jgi:MFS family permease
MIASTVMAMVTIVFPAKERGRAIGIYVSSVYAWLSVSPLLGGLLTEYTLIGWRSIFLFNIPFALIMLALLTWKVKGEWSECGGEKFDYTGSAIWGLALLSVIYGFSLLPEISGIIIALAGAVGVLLFLWWENRIHSPVLDVRAFRSNRPFITANLASIITYSTTTAIAFMINLYLQYIKGLSPDQAGLILILQPIVQTAIAPFTGRLSDKIESRIVASAGMMLLAAGLILFAFLNENTPLAQIFVALVIVGAGFGLFVPPNTNAIMSSVQPRYYAVASSLTSTMRTVGQTLSMGITMVIMAIVIGKVVITQEYFSDFLSSSQITFTIFAILCFAGIFASLMGSKQNKN